jgi:hypothetical protein
MAKIFALICGVMISSAAMAQDYGLTIGVHQTTASIDATDTSSQLGGATTGSVSGRLGYDLGLTASFELVPSWRFRTGALYDLRPFDYKIPNFGTVGYNFSYIDVPVNVQYNFTPVVGIYGGMIVGIKASDSQNLPSNASSTVGPNMKSLYPFLNAGLNFTFNDLLGFDVYYESGIGSFSDNGKSYSTFGMHFIYWL